MMGAPVNVDGPLGSVEVKLGQPPSAMRSTGGGCPVNHGNGPAIPSGCPMSQENVGGVERMNPVNMMPMNTSQEPSPGQPFPLSVEREVSTIPKAGADEKWVYPSGQMFWDTMIQKGWKWENDHEKEKFHKNDILCASQMIQNRQLKSRKNDYSKKMADQRWRRSMHENIESLRRVLAKDFVFRDGTIIKRRECRSRNDLLAKVSDLIVDLESAINTQCSGSSPALSPNDNLNGIKMKFKSFQRAKDQQETSSAKSRKNSENFLPTKYK